ncbi:MAG: prolyl oligopeptidase family serine peptidase [Saprospiraceae bacterium]|nr:prolyl oligopeptidase family serine peptidase [Saprospiraceae bacterium]
MIINVGCNSQSNEAYPYNIYYPIGYDASSDKGTPLMIFLHGSGERGTDLSQVENHGPPKKVKEGRQFQCIIFAPQCPNDVWWDVDRLNSTLDEVLAKNNIDQTRIYLTGLSMGGYGTWAWAIENPNKFAAIAPICGGGDPDKAELIAHIPTWVFHGAQDDVVPVEKSKEMVSALKAAGATPRFSVYAEADHDSWTQTYDSDSFYGWLFGQRLK